MIDPPAPTLDSLLKDTTWLRGLARALVGERDAEDLVQDTWVRALQAGPRSASAARSWMRTVARNLARDGRRGAAHRAARERAAARRESLPSSEDLAQRVELFEKLARAVRSLEEPYRTTITLRYLEELSTRAIAERTGAPERTIETRLRRGLSQLGTKLDAMHAGDRQAWFGLCALVAGGEALGRAQIGWVAALFVLVAGGAAAAVWRPSGPAGSEPREPRALAAPAELAEAPAAEDGRREPTAAGRKSTRVTLEVTDGREPLAGLALADELAGLVTDERGQVGFDWDPAWGRALRVVIPATDTTCGTVETLSGPGLHHVRVPARGGTLRVYVTDLELEAVETQVLVWRTRKPAEIDLSCPDRVAETDWAGRAVLAGMAGDRAGRAGEFTLLVANGEWVSLQVVTGSVAPKDSEDVTLLVGASRSVVAEVQDPRGARLAGARLGVRFDAEGTLEELERDLDSQVLRTRKKARTRLRHRYESVVRYETGADASGAFRLFAPAQEDLRLTARHERFASATLDHAPRDPAPTLRLGRGARVSGVVLADGRPLAGATVQVQSPDRKRSQRTAADGAFLFEGVTFDEGFLVVAGAPGHATAVRELSAGAGSEEDVRHALSALGYVEGGSAAADEEMRLELGPGLTLEGRVFDESGEPLSTWVTFRDSLRLTSRYAFQTSSPFRAATQALFAWPHGGRVASDEEGRFLVEGLEPGDYLFWTSAPDGFADGAARVRADRRARVTLRRGSGLEHKANLDLELIDARTGEPIRDATYRLVPVQVDASGRWQRGQAHVASLEDRVRLDGIEPGSYVLEVARGPLVLDSGWIEIPSGWVSLTVSLNESETDGR